LLYVDVILPFPLENLYTYILPENLSAKIGVRVLVPFGARRVYAGIVAEVRNDAPNADFSYKEVIDVLDAEPILLPNQLKLWQWIAKYYCCSLGDVFKMAMPSEFRLESETVLKRTEDCSLDSVKLSSNEQKIMDVFADGKVHELSSLQKELGVKNAFVSVRKLIDKNILSLHEEVVETYRPLQETYVSFLSIPQKKLTEKQQKIVHFFQENQITELPKAKLKNELDISDAVISTAVKNGIVELVKKEKSRIAEKKFESQREFTLSDAQQTAFDEIEKQFLEKNIVLLHGVTSSGKTEIYIRLIQNLISQGKQVLYLVPEIALTTQLTSRLQEVFGNDLGIYHSGFSNNQRVEIWKRMLGDNPNKIMLGTRSAIFLPFKNIALTVIDEEQETSYKQQEMLPRYHARTVAVMLGKINGSKILLGTATPSVESEYNVKTGKYGKVLLNERYGNVSLPEIIVADVKELRRKKQMKSPIFSPILIEKMQEALNKKEQIILFQNHRGYASVVECADCGYVPHCRVCDVSLTSHQYSKVLVCHYCGRNYTLPKVCPKCGKSNFTDKGFGTERVEEEVQNLFPSARVARLDFDTTRKKHSYEEIISSFENGETDILVGTQMVSKGLDFDNVSVVGVINADSMLNLPDFRANEQAFQMLMQVSGRAGRRNCKGTVVVQTSQAEHPIIKQVLTADFSQMLNSQLLERYNFHYPPYFRLVSLSLRHRDKDVLHRASLSLYDLLRKSFAPEFILGPEIPPVSRVKLMYTERFLIKMDIRQKSEDMKTKIKFAIEQMLSQKEYQYVQTLYDVDPM